MAHQIPSFTPPLGNIIGFKEVLWGFSPAGWLKASLALQHLMASNTISKHTCCHTWLACCRYTHLATVFAAHLPPGWTHAEVRKFHQLHITTCSAPSSCCSCCCCSSFTCCCLLATQSKTSPWTKDPCAWAAAVAHLIWHQTAAPAASSG